MTREDRESSFSGGLGPEMYELGLRGVYADEEQEGGLLDDVRAQGENAFASGAVLRYGIEDGGRGKLILLTEAMVKQYPGCIPGGAQQRGDCVSWAGRTALAASYAQECVTKTPDPVTGKVESFPAVSDEGRKWGVFSSEVFYWHRRHGGDGWNGAAFARVAIKEAGLVVRADYPEARINLETYSASLAGKWGRTPPDGAVADLCRTHLARTATVVKTYEELRDIIAAGYGVLTTGSEAWQRTRDPWGRCARSAGSWAHAIAACGVDDRPETVRQWGCGLVLLVNSWNEYMTGPRGVWGTSQEIPPGSFWTRWTDMSKRYMIALSDLHGWANKGLKDWGARGVT